MRKVHLLPNVITAFALSCGLFVIFRMSMIDANDTSLHVLISMAGILLLAAFADLLDGAIARAIGAESEFGGFFDSLADAITFGVAPSVIILKSSHISHEADLSFFLMIAALVYSVCGVLRLVRFNVMSNAAKGNLDLSTAHKKNFTGLPIPAAATAVISANLFLVSDELRSVFYISDLWRAWIMFGILIFIGYLMICRLKFPSLKNLHIRVKSFQIVFFTVLSALLIVYGILHHFAVIFFVVAWAYPLTALLLSFIRFLSGEKLKTLEDFEPEPDDEQED
jgi:CDP-diacylglycerol--serine O-phosphatidyltransferase